MKHLLFLSLNKHDHWTRATSELLEVLLVHAPGEDVLLVVAAVPVARAVVGALGPHTVAVAAPVGLIGGDPGVVLEPLLLAVPGVEAQAVPGVVVGGVGHPGDHCSPLMPLILVSILLRWVSLVSRALLFTCSPPDSQTLTEREVLSRGALSHSFALGTWELVVYNSL